jgi:AcrR family transcriptional regulator
MMIRDAKERARMEAGKRGPVRDRIVDAALDLGGERGWSNVRMYQVAERAGVPLATIAAEFRDMDALANAWFARALVMVERIPPRRWPASPHPSACISSSCAGSTRLLRIGR